MKPFEIPQGSVKKKFKLSFIFIQLTKMHGTGRVKLLQGIMEKSLGLIFISVEMYHRRVVTEELKRKISMRFLCDLKFIPC